MYMGRTHGHVTVFISVSGVLEAMAYILNYYKLLQYHVNKQNIEIVMLCVTENILSDI